MSHLTRESNVFMCHIHTEKTKNDSIMPSSGRHQSQKRYIWAFHSFLRRIGLDERKKNNKLAQDEQKGKWFWVFNVAMNSLSLPIPLDRFGLVNSKSCAWERFHLPLNWIATRYETILSYIFFFSLSLAICLLLFGIRVYPFSCSAHNFQWAYFLSNGPLLLSFWPFALNIWLLHLLST